MSKLQRFMSRFAGVVRESLTKAFWKKRLAVLAPTLVGIFGIGMLIGALFLWFLIFTLAELKRGDLSREWLAGTKITAKFGAFFYADLIPTREYVVFLQRSSNEHDKGLVIALLGWKGMSASLSELRRLSTTGGRLGKQAILSAVAIERQMKFKGQDINEEYFDEYSQRAIQLMKSKKIPLEQAAVEVITELQAQRQ